MREISIQESLAAIGGAVSAGCSVSETLRFSREHRLDDVRRLALGAVPIGVDRAMAMSQVAGWQAARVKLPSWAACEDIIYPPRLSMEQCSSEEAAAQKAGLVVGDSLVDLTGGLGVDFAAMAARVSRATMVERDPHLAALARLNLSSLGFENVTVVNGEAQEFVAAMLAPVGTIYLDPARRSDKGQRVFAISDCSPDAAALAPRLLEMAQRVIVKLSPMLDVSETLRVLPSVSQLHVVAIDGECKELLVVMDRGYEGVPLIVCRDGARQFSYKADERVVPATLWDETVREGMLLCVPNATMMKAGCHDRVAARWNVQLVSRNSHLMVTVGPGLGLAVSDFPGRVFSVQNVTTMGKRELREALRGVERANVAVRNFPMAAEQLRQRLRLKDGGDTYVFGTRTASGRHVLIIAK